MARISSTRGALAFLNRRATSAVVTMPPAAASAVRTARVCSARSLGQACLAAFAGCAARCERPSDVNPARGCPKRVHRRQKSIAHQWHDRRHVHSNGQIRIDDTETRGQRGMNDVLADFLADHENERPVMDLPCPDSHSDPNRRTVLGCDPRVIGNSKRKPAWRGSAESVCDNASA